MNNLFSNYFLNAQQVIEQEFLAQLHKLVPDGRPVLAAVSGGADSMALAALLLESRKEFAMAHCNFSLRGEESDGDEQLVRDWASNNKVPVFVQQFDTPAILAAEGGNLQDTARRLRYQWFGMLCREHGFGCIATAHHLQDSVETMLINFFKGTGIQGLHGILPRQGSLVRPLLPFTKEQLVAYNQNKGIPWRDDSSNLKTDYTRNAVRHKLLPLVAEIFPQAMHNLAGNTHRMQEAEQLYLQQIEQYRGKLIEQRGADRYIPLKKLAKVQPLPTVLYELIKPYGFGPQQLPDALRLMEAESAKYIQSEDFRLVKNRDFFILTKLKESESNHILVEEEGSLLQTPHFSLRISPKNFDIGQKIEVPALPKSEIWVDAEQLTFPLVLRPWKVSDYFYPFGMNGKKKKISKFLIGEKLNAVEKEKVWVVENDRKIVWVVGLRMDERFKISKTTKSVLRFSVSGG
ncbi:MAG: tRNA lysidine(34) synthetase TilS [Edaphocola sp.]